MSQLPLPLRLDDHAVFDTFLPTGNESVVEHLTSLAAAAHSEGAWICGPHTTGKTHLAQATCERLGDRAVYLPLRELAGLGPGLLEGLSSREVVALDDIDALAGDGEWELALFTLYNELDDAGGLVLACARAPQRETDFELADLRSRMQRLPTFRLRALDDDARIDALQLRARHRGIELPLETARFLMNRRTRDMRSLYELLDTLDLEALRAQRKLTIPFVKHVIEDL